MKVSSILPIGITAILSTLAPTAHAVESPTKNIASGLDLMNEMQQLQQSLTHLQSLLANAEVREDQFVMDKAAKLFRRARWLVYATSREHQLKKQEVERELKAARGLENAETEIEREALRDIQLRGSEPRKLVEPDEEEVLRDLYEATISFPECLEMKLPVCLEIISEELAGLGMDCETITHDKRTIHQEGYNKVVIVTNLAADLVNGRNHDGIVQYPFMWEDINEGFKTVGVDGKWDCQHLSPEACCNAIKTSVPGMDVKGNYIQCHIFVPFGGIGNAKRSNRVIVNVSQDGRVQEAPVVS